MDGQTNERTNEIHEVVSAVGRFGGGVRTGRRDVSLKQI